MKGNDEITGLFRSRLSGAEMTVRDGFWEELKGDLSRVETDATNTSAATKRSVLTPRFYRVAAAASVVLVLGAASAAFWYFSPKDEIQEAFTKVATLTPEGNLNGDVVQEKFPSIHETKPTAQNPGHKNPVPVSSGGILAANGDDEETVSVTVSITIPNAYMAITTKVTECMVKQLHQGMKIIIVSRLLIPLSQIQSLAQIPIRRSPLPMRVVVLKNGLSKQV